MNLFNCSPLILYFLPKGFYLNKKDNFVFNTARRMIFFNWIELCFT
jgi:hypothetical protein